MKQGSTYERGLAGVIDVYQIAVEVDMLVLSDLNGPCRRYGHDLTRRVLQLGIHPVGFYRNRGEARGAHGRGTVVDTLDVAVAASRPNVCIECHAEIFLLGSL